MKQYINKRIMIIASAAILMTAVFCTFACYRVFREEVKENLRICTRLLSDRENIQDEAVLSKYASELYNDSIRLTLISKEGDVIFDNVARIEGLDNHLNREEIEEAIENGEGYSIRRSATINRTNYYYAVRLEDGSILRTARESHSIINIFWNAVPVILFVILILLVICYFSSQALTTNLLAPVEAIAANMNHPETIHTYAELEPIIEHIRNQHNDILDHANLRQEFTANVSHELKTPLTSISGYAELIENGLAGEDDTQKFAAEIHKNADRLLTLINDILRLSEFDGLKESDFETEEVDLYDIAGTCLDMLEFKAREHDISFSLEGEKTLVTANRNMMDEVVYNLCDNAIRYNRPGGYIRVYVGDHKLMVSDNGIGIPPEYQHRVFERFFRVDKSRSKRTGGTGLGLAIVKHIVTLHGAELSLESAPEQGTRVTIQFPDN